MKIRRGSPPPPATQTGNSPLDDVIESKRQRRPKPPTEVGLRNGSVDARALRTTGCRLPDRKRKRAPLDCDVEGDEPGGGGRCLNGSDDGNAKNLCRKPTTSAANPTSDGTALNLRQPTALNLHQVNNFGGGIFD